MRNLLQTLEVSWAQSVKLSLESQGIEAVVLDENLPGSMGFAGRVRVAVLNDDDFERARAILATLTPPMGPPPPSWRLQKRGLRLLALGFAFLVVSAVLRDRDDPPVPSMYVYAAWCASGVAFIAGFLLIALGPRADKGQPQ